MVFIITRPDVDALGNGRFHWKCSTLTEAPPSRSTVERACTETPAAVMDLPLSIPFAFSSAMNMVPASFATDSLTIAMWNVSTRSCCAVLPRTPGRLLTVDHAGSMNAQPIFVINGYATRSLHWGNPQATALMCTYLSTDSTGDSTTLQSDQHPLSLQHTLVETRMNGTSTKTLPNCVKATASLGIKCFPRQMPV